MKVSQAKFKDHFSGHAGEYAQFRPTYPGELFAYLAGIAPTRECAWDCATGNGQAATGLAPYFDLVIATDASARQIQSARQHSRIKYRVATAENSELKAGSVDLIAVAQALHWFDLPEFFAEAKRVLREEGILAAWAYNLISIAPGIDEIINAFYGVTVGPFWPAERVIVEAGYATIDFPFQELRAPPFQMKTRWTLPQLLGYLRTWSATRKYMETNKTDPVRHLETELKPIWGAETRAIVWPLSLRLGRK